MTDDSLSDATRSAARRPARAPAGIGIRAHVAARIDVADATGQHEQLTVHLDEPGLGRIERWEVDPDYDGTTFRPAWHGTRAPAAAGAPSQVVATATISTPAHDGPRTVCVRALDGDGVRSERVIELPARALL